MTDHSRLPIRYPARYDYGSRRGYPTRAVVFHMAEGTNVARYLSQGDVARGVSVHYCIERRTSLFADGEIVRILPEQRISGSIDPDTIRRTNDPNGYYGVTHNRAALGSYWDNPNVAVVSVEVAGRAKDGPTKSQVESMVALFEDIERRYDRVIPLGHRDFQDVKPCPGQTAAIRAAFAAMGGHGTSYSTSPERRFMSTRGFVPGQVCDVAEGAKLFNYPGAKAFGTVSGDLTRQLLGYSPSGREYALITTELDKNPQRTAWVKATQIANVRVGDTSPDCSGPTSLARAEALDEAEAAIAAIER